MRNRNTLFRAEQGKYFKPNAMLFQVQRGLVRVPLELHGQFPLVLYGTIITDMPAICKTI